MPARVERGLGACYHGRRFTIPLYQSPDSPRLTVTTAPTTISSADVQEMIDTRRDLHAHPEIAFEEMRTSALVAERLRALGLTVHTGVGRTGVLATVTGERPGKTVLLRADMDALPIQEENDVPYRSQNAGQDARLRARLPHLDPARRREAAGRATRPSLPGAVRLCFQPAEE